MPPLQFERIDVAFNQPPTPTKPLLMFSLHDGSVNWVGRVEVFRCFFYLSLFIQRKAFKDDMMM